MRTITLNVLVVLSMAFPAFADSEPAFVHNATVTEPLTLGRAHREVWHIDWKAIDNGDAGAAATPAVVPQSARVDQSADTQPLHAAAIEHSDAYQRRAKLHKYASFATLPLFAGELALGQSLYNNPGGNRGLHSLVGGGIIGLFGLNTVTGAWNLFGEGTQDQPGRTLRLVHGLMMMAADGGFVATWATAPHGGGRSRTSPNFDHNKMVHRDIAVASISVGTASYLLMLLSNH